MTLIDGDRIITALLYDDEHEEFKEEKMSIIDYLDAYTNEGHQPKIKISNSEWVGFLSDQFDISRTSAKEMLHVMMSVKKEDNFKKQFSGRKDH